MTEQEYYEPKEIFEPEKVKSPEEKEEEFLRRSDEEYHKQF